jgi:hypothetical protein
MRLTYSFFREFQPRLARPSRRGLQCAALLLVALVAGCKQNVDLSAVKALAKTAGDARPSYDALAADYYQSCVRTSELKSIASAMRTGFLHSPIHQSAHPKAYAVGRSPEELRKSLPTVLAALPVADLGMLDISQVQAIVARPDISDVFEKFSADQRASFIQTAANAGANIGVYTCSDSREVSEQWRRRLDAYVGFFASLGKLAGGATSADRFGISKFANSLQSAGVFTNDSQAQSFSKLGNLLGSGIFDWKRREELAKYLKEAEAPLDIATSQLTSVGKNNYPFALRQERDAFEAFRSSNLRLAAPGADAFAVYRYAKQVLADEDAISSRQDAAGAYVKSINDLNQAYKQITAAVDRNDLASAEAVAAFYYDDVHADIAMVAKAFKGVRK